MVTTGGTAPDFIAPAAVEGEAVVVKLFERIEANDAVVLQFFPAAFVSTCTAELCAIRDAGWHSIPGLEVIGLSADSLFSQVAYADQYDLSFPLVSDFHGGVAETYDLLADEWEGHSRIPKRGAVVVDGDWTVRTVETASDPLDRAIPGPAERATAAIRDCGFDVEPLAVSYEQFM